jgi:heme-degrading monooxygenase HmoA
MITHLSIHTPKPGKEQDLIDSMHRFGAAGAGQPGFVEAMTLRDQRSGRLVGMARWEDEASWRAGVEAMRAAVEADPFDEWEAAETESFLLEDA